MMYGFLQTAFKRRTMFFFIVNLIYYCLIYPYFHIHHAHDDDPIPFELSIHPIDIDIDHHPSVQVVKEHNHVDNHHDNLHDNYHHIHSEFTEEYDIHQHDNYEASEHQDHHHENDIHDDHHHHIVKPDQWIALRAQTAKRIYLISQNNSDIVPAIWFEKASKTKYLNYESSKIPQYIVISPLMLRAPPIYT